MTAETYTIDSEESRVADETPYRTWTCGVRADHKLVFGVPDLMLHVERFLGREDGVDRFRWTCSAGHEWIQVISHEALMADEPEWERVK